MVLMERYLESFSARSKTPRPAAVAPWKAVDEAFDTLQYGCIPRAVAKAIINGALIEAECTLSTYSIHLPDTPIVEATRIGPCLLMPIVTLANSVHYPDAFHEPKI
jgi:hypothetical protein